MGLGWFGLVGRRVVSEEKALFITSNREGDFDTSKIFFMWGGSAVLSKLVETKLWEAAPSLFFFFFFCEHGD